MGLDWRRNLLNNNAIRCTNHEYNAACYINCCKRTQSEGDRPNYYVIIRFIDTVCMSVMGRNLCRMEGNKGYMWKQPRTDSMAVFEQIYKLPWREMLSMEEKEDLLAQEPKELWTAHPNEVGRIKKMQRQCILWWIKPSLYPVSNSTLYVKRPEEELLQ